MSMMEDETGFDVDDLSKIRVLDNETASKTGQLKEECKDFIDSESYVILISLSYVLQKLRTKIQIQKYELYQPILRVDGQPPLASPE